MLNIWNRWLIFILINYFQVVFNFKLIAIRRLVTYLACLCAYHSRTHYLIYALLINALFPLFSYALLDKFYEPATRIKHKIIIISYAITWIPRSIPGQSQALTSPPASRSSQLARCLCAPRIPCRAWSCHERAAHAVLCCHVLTRIYEDLTAASTLVWCTDYFT